MSGLGSLALLAVVASPVGSWLTYDDRSGEPRSVIRISVEAGRLRGVVERVLPRPGQDPDPVCTRCRGERRGRRVVGMAILWDHRPEGDGWSDGRVLDPENGREYGSRVWLEGPDVLRVRGYWGPFHRTQTWRRAEGSR